MSALMTEEYLTARAKRGGRKDFLAALSRVPDVEPVDADLIRSPADKALQKPGRRPRRR